MGNLKKFIDKKPECEHVCLCSNETVFGYTLQLTQLITVW